MAITNGYATLPEFKAWNEIQVDTNDADAERAVEASSRWIDSHCGRHFWTVTEPRVLDAASSGEVAVRSYGDIVSVTEVATDADGDGTFETVWAPTDYQLLPVGAAVGPEPRPYRVIAAIGGKSFPAPTCGGRKGRVRVTGEWGWPDVPTAVKQACLIQAARIYKRRISPEGVTGFGSEFGVGAIRLSARPDPDAVALLGPYRVMAQFVA